MAGKAVASDTKVGATDFEKVYFATVTVSITLEVPNTVTVMIDGNTVSGTTITLAKGEHIVTFSQINTDKNEYVISLDGVQVTDGKVDITETSKKITISVDSPEPVDSQPE